MDDNVTEEDWPKYFTALGEFVVNFENIVFDIRQDSVYLLKYGGLKDPIMGAIVFGQKQFTAEPILSCYVSLIYHVIGHKKGKEELLEKLNCFRTEFSKIIEVRNNILHATHFYVESINFLEPRDSKRQEFKAFKPSPKKTGYHIEKTVHTVIVKSTVKLKSLRTDLNIFVKELHEFIERK
jgi:hypothetical protein